jgi:hypothetical protein
MSARTVLLSIAVPLLSTAALAADGLAPPNGADIWPQWQARLTVSTTRLAPVSLSAWTDPATATHPSLQSGSLLGDYYLDAPGLRLPRSLGGLRATGGLMTGARGLAPTTTPSMLRSGQRTGLATSTSVVPLAGDTATDTVPYLGVGYTGLALKGGWGFTADLGLVAENPAGAAHVGRALFGNQGLDNSLRELRLSPVLQVGVSYSF